MERKNQCNECELIMKRALYQSSSLCYSDKIESCSVPLLLLKAVWFDMLQSNVFTCEATSLTVYREVCILLWVVMLKLTELTLFFCNMQWILIWWTQEITTFNVFLSNSKEHGRKSEAKMVNIFSFVIFFVCVSLERNQRNRKCVCVFWSHRDSSLFALLLIAELALER